MFNKVTVLLFGSMLISNYLFAGKINIAVAANVSYAIDELKKAFNQQYPHTKVQVTLGSSGKLTAQIKNGAPYDLFMSANMIYPNALYKEALAITKPLIYAQGSLAYLSGKKQNFEKGILLIKEKGIKRIAIANPKTAPYGIATIEALKNSHIYDEVLNKFVYAESISQTVSYAITAADIGFIAKSSLYSPKMSKYKKNIHYADVNPKLYTPINQGMVILKKAQGNDEVSAFYNFILGKQAKEIFNKFGYITHE
mgnify:CR=1 FL=1